MRGDQPLNVFFLCTANSVRSIMAECSMNRWADGRFRGFSAGSQPAGAGHPMAIETLRRLHLDVKGLRSKSWGEFSGPGSATMDFIITVCDKAAGELCPV